MNDNAKLSQARILIAEDDPSNRKVTQLMLERLGYEADAVTNRQGVLQSIGQFDEARKCFERALVILRDRLGENHPSTRTVRNNLESLDSKR